MQLTTSIALQVLPASQLIISSQKCKMLQRGQPTIAQRAFTSAAPCKRVNIVSRCSTSRRAGVLVRASADTTTPAAVETKPLWTELYESCAAFKKAPLSMVRTFVTIDMGIYLLCWLGLALAGLCGDAQQALCTSHTIMHCLYLLPVFPVRNHQCLLSSSSIVLYRAAVASITQPYVMPSAWSCVSSPPWTHHLPSPNAPP